MDGGRMPRLSDRYKAAIIIGALFVFEGFFVTLSAYPSPRRFLVYLGFLPGPHTPAPLGWVAAAFVVVLFVWLSMRLPSVRKTMLSFDLLKVLALGLAVAAGILEELAFRSLLMDSLMKHGANLLLQVAISAIAFGLMHAIWAFFRGSWRAGVGACVATGALGLGLAIVYLASSRSIAPCVAAHFLINALVEPGLVLAAVRGEMGKVQG
jgi:hypothetical protein